MHNLLKIVCNGNLAAYLQFEKENGSFLKAQNLEGDLTHRMYLLSICALATEKRVLSYKDVAQTLGLSEDEVEIWVVEAVLSGLITASVNQASRQIVVR